MIEKIKKILESQIGKKNSITSKEIAKKIGITEDDTHAKTRALILKCIEEHELPVVAHNKGYYFIADQSEFDEYIKNLNSRIKGIEERKEIVSKNYEKWKKKNDLHTKK